MARKPFTLGIDIGATGLKAAVLDAEGEIVVPQGRVPTPKKGTPDQVLKALTELIAPLGTFDRISMGFPGVVRSGHVMTAPNLDNAAWHDYPLASVLSDRLGKPARILNDATVHGLGVIARTGLECVITLGTGMGFALFDDGHLTPHLELSHHPIHGDEDYDAYIGNEALQDIGRKRWNKRVAHALACIRGLTGYDTLYIGGGNARHLKLELEKNIQIVPNEAGIIGGVRLWDKKLDTAFNTGRSI
jgi:polyphosphate glucokinase